jgi:hypothetical protein
MGVNKMKFATGPAMDVIRKETVSRWMMVLSILGPIPSQADFDLSSFAFQMPMASVEDFMMPMDSDEEEEELLFEDVYTIGKEVSHCRAGSLDLNIYIYYHVLRIGFFLSFLPFKDWRKQFCQDTPGEPSDRQEELRRQTSGATGVAFRRCGRVE